MQRLILATLAIVLSAACASDHHKSDANGAARGVASAYPPGNYKPGDRVGSDYFLFTDDIGGGYSNSWFGHIYANRPDPDARDKWVTVIISGQGKEAEFKGSLAIDCTTPSKSYWSYAQNFGQEDQSGSTVPANAIAEARRLFCK